VLPELLSAFPRWLVVGLGLGGVFSLLVAGAFIIGGRLFPDGPGPGPGSGPGPGPGSGAATSRIDGTARRRSEIRQYLVDIDERFREDVEVEGETIAFFLPERSVAITFDAQAYFRLESRGIYTVLCEHEMPGRHLGARLPFEVPDLDPDEGDVTDPIAAAFGHLGLDTDASSEEVKTAYRERVKQVHPDQGGDREQFERVREAYATARNHAD
jgi:hypothetical protein